MKPSMNELTTIARRLATTGQRTILGITGPPGAGKSTVADAIVEAVGDAARLVGMDGFHLAQRVLARLGRQERKGAPDTFDADGYVALLRRLRANTEPVVYAPWFDRSIEEPIACAVPVERDVPLVVTEGNYLLVEDGGWAHVRPLLGACWYVDLDERTRIDRLVTRHVRFGRSREQAREWVLRSDQSNAELVATTRHRADLIVVAP
ncbi:MAG TPA: nucleoside/nucleotide kinase family protein [Jiangellaceae bacterium]|nr:nucleoside/nucleotide kinase family protein [Jiangellaceae bacterium]